MKKQLSALALFFFFSIVYSQGSQSAPIVAGLTVLVVQVQELLPIICMLLVMCAGVVYAAGSVAGAETRAKAASWATVMVMGAMIGIIMSIVLPRAFCAMFPSSWSIQGAVLEGQALCG